MVVFDVEVEVTGKAVDGCRQQRHLHFGRSGVALGALMVRDDLRLLRNRKWHSNSLHRKARYLKAKSAGSTRVSRPGRMPPGSQGAASSRLGCTPPAPSANPSPRNLPPVPYT